MKFQFSLYFLIFSSIFSVHNREINNDNFDVEKNRFIDDTTHMSYLMSAYERLNEYRENNRNDTCNNASQERDCNTQTQEHFESRNDASNRENLDYNEQADYEAFFDHQQLMALENRREEYLASKKPDKYTNHSRLTRSCDSFPHINYNNSLVEELVNNGQTKRLFTEKIIPLTNEAQSMLSDLGIEKLFKADIERFEKREQSLFSLVNNLLNRAGFLYSRFKIDPVSAQIAQITIVCAVCYDLIKKGEIRPVPDLLKIGYAAISKTHEYCIEFCSGIANLSISIIQSPGRFLYEKASNFWNFIRGTKKIIDFGNWLLCTDPQDMMNDVKEGVTTAQCIVSAISNKISRMSADDWDKQAKSIARGAGRLITDLVTHYTCQSLTSLFSSITSVLKLGEAVEIVEQTAAPTLRSAKYLDVVWDEALQAYVVQQSIDVPMIVNVAEKTMLPVVQGVRLVGSIEHAAPVSTLVVSAGAISKIPQVITVASAMEGSEVAVEKIPQVAVKTVEDILKECVKGQKTKGPSKQYEKLGYFEDVIKDFESLPLINIKDASTPDKICKVGELGEITVIARNYSTSTEPTLEIQYSRNKVFKIRYKANL